MSAIIFSWSAIIAWSLVAMPPDALALSAAACCGSCVCPASPIPAVAATKAHAASIAVVILFILMPDSL